MGSATLDVAIYEGVTGDPLVVPELDVDAFFGIV